ncbi:ABC transporter ATP-binding protein [Agromyces aerolatus]|uniref:ABC transporter ATP-binding protein n=1 Tax=Agromyces sp. LY-1074 TaxID=3074080 RepID=UPI0028548B38|nr:MULTISPECIES: ABC transporter ATP-binding protein [unclassified Agromyces]MDR5699463.1 ABC transporter ATP-binding protein [Agromyces sp. LY-1074]MDR5705759.1 ABC transporter ATP-binding protein [Agromyces sp. LY-1358]
MRLEARDVSKTFGKAKHGVVAVNRVSVAVEPGDFVAIVGESGSGKSTLARMLLDLIERDPGDGSITLDGRDLRAMTRAEKQAYRRAVQCVLQDPSGSLNPRKTIRQSLTEVIRFHRIATRAREVEQTAIEVLAQVGLNPPATYLDRFPHELSGGQRQRVLIARAIVLRPKLIIADEAVSALDVAVKAGVLNLMNEVRQDLGVGYVLITHDLPVVKKVATYVYVMRNGEVVEEGPKDAIFEAPKHEYTRALLDAAPDLDAALAR